MGTKVKITEDTQNPIGHGQLLWPSMVVVDGREKSSGNFME
jgi:hypothetical protein